MEDRTTARKGARARAETLAEIQARLELVEDNLAISASDAAPVPRVSDDLFAQADEIERMLEDLMEPDPSRTPEAPCRSTPRWTSRTAGMYREEEDAAAELSKTGEARLNTYPADGT